MTLSIQGYQRLQSGFWYKQSDESGPYLYDGFNFSPAGPAQQRAFRAGFDRSFANAVDPLQFAIIAAGAGQTVNQTGGSLVITAGTTANAQTIIRSLPSFGGQLKMRWSATLSQRIVNNNFFVEMVDVIGDGLAFTVNSATSVSVTIPSNPFTSANVGQSMYLGAITLAGCPEGRYAIASVVGNVVTFTVAGFPGAGAGTLSLFGWNFHHVVYNGVTDTNAGYDTARNGWASGDTALSVNPLAAGHVGTLCMDGARGSFLDQTSASATSQEVTQRGSRVRNIPNNEVVLYVQIRAQNGSVAPASSTTFTLGFVDIDDILPMQVTLVGVEAMGAHSGLPTNVLGAIAAGSNLVGDMGTQYRANATGAASSSHLVAAATTNATVIKAGPGRVVGWNLYNASAAPKFVKFHNTAAVPTPGAGVVRTVGIAAGASLQYELNGGIAHSVGIGITITGAAADADVTAVAAGDVIADIFYA